MNEKNAFTKTFNKCLQPAVAPKIKQLNMRLPEDDADVCRDT